MIICSQCQHFASAPISGDGRRQTYALICAHPDEENEAITDPVTGTKVFRTGQKFPFAADVNDDGECALHLPKVVDLEPEALMDVPVSE